MPLFVCISLPLSGFPSDFLFNPHPPLPCLSGVARGVSAYGVVYAQVERRVRLVWKAGAESVSESGEWAEGR